MILIPAPLDSSRLAPDATIGLLWLPALGVACRHYERFGAALLARGVMLQAVEWRGTGASTSRAGREHDWGYRELLEDAKQAFDDVQRAKPGLTWMLGGHSMGGQLAALLAATMHLEESDANVPPRALVLVATGVPHWQLFRGSARLGVRFFAEALPLLTSIVGHFPGRMLGFAGREASGVMLDWRRSVLTGNYTARGLEVDFESALRLLQVPVLGISLQQDWLAPVASMQELLAKMPLCASEELLLDSTRIGVHADHFAWLKQPEAIAEAIAVWASAGTSRSSS